MKEKTIYALGFFDGVHKGHQALLDACRSLAQTNGWHSGVVTFTCHPDTLVTGKAPGLINTIEDRKRLLHAYGMDTVLALPFDNALMTTHWSSFLQQLMDLGAAGFVCGWDFRFGANGNGTAKKLAAFCQDRNLPCAIVPQQALEGVRVSSTHIRNLLAQGDLARANRFLGHPHTLTGEVVSGRQLGRTIGIPTANLLPPEEVVSLPHGVYACKAIIPQGEFLAVTNIGSRPTVGGHRVTVESWLLDFEGDLYGQKLTLHFYQFLRPEQKFDSLEQLQDEIRKNALQVGKIFEKS